MARGALVRQYIGSDMVRQYFFLVFGPPLLLAQGTSVRHKYWRIISIRGLCSVRLTYFHAYRLLIELYKWETEIC